MDLRNYPEILRKGALLVALSLSLIAADMPSLVLPAPEEPKEEGTVVNECCFIHPNYQGVCAVVPAEDETCDAILQYLNSPATVGKTYCDNTRIRGGWERVECPGDE